MRWYGVYWMITVNTPVRQLDLGSGNFCKH
jgi:hypothetical protein